MTIHDNGSIIKKPQGNLRTWGHRTRDFFGSPVKRRKAPTLTGGQAYGGYFLRTPEEPNISFSFFLRKPFRGEVISMYVTWDQLLLVGGFILSLIKLLRDIYNKKK